MNVEHRTSNAHERRRAAFNVQNSTFEVQSSVSGRDWYWLDTGPGRPAFNMALDEALLEAMPRWRRPVLRFYGWTEPAASFGYFQKYAEVADATSLRPLVRRPTGGGLVPHARDWTYSLAFPAGHEWHSLRASASYIRVHEWIRRAFERLGVATELAPVCRKARPGQCFAGYEKFDLLCHGRKIAGAAQRRTREGLLIQGSLQPVPDRESSPVAAMESGPAPLSSLSRADWQQAMCAAAAGAGVVWTEYRPDRALGDRATELESAKYACESYNRKR